MFPGHTNPHKCIVYSPIISRAVTDDANYCHNVNEIDEVHLYQSTDLLNAPHIPLIHSYAAN